MAPLGDIAVNRRRFLTGAAAGGLALVVPARPAGAGVVAPALGPPELGAFGELVAALRAAPDGRFRAVDPARAERALVHWYRRQAAGARRHVAHVLEALAADGVPDYATLARPPRVVDDAGAARSAVRAAAIALAGQLLEPDDGAACAPALAAG